MKRQHEEHPLSQAATHLPNFKRSPLTAKQSQLTSLVAGGMQVSVAATCLSACLLGKGSGERSNCGDVMMIISLPFSESPLSEGNGISFLEGPCEEQRRLEYHYRRGLLGKACNSQFSAQPYLTPCAEMEQHWLWLCCVLQGIL